jgi:hypothetical protein
VYESSYPSNGEGQNVVGCAHEGRGVVAKVAGTLRAFDGSAGDENEAGVDVGRLEVTDLAACAEVDRLVEILGRSFR